MPASRPGASPGAFPVLRRVALFWIAYFVILFLASIPRGMAPPSWAQLVWGLVATPPLLALAVFLARREVPPLRAIGASPGGRDVAPLLGGLLLGFASYAAVLLAISLLVTPIRLAAAPAPAAGPLLLAVGTVFVLAYMEELGFRGYSLRALEGVVGTWPAQGLVALAFALSHFAFGWEWSQVLYGVLPSAVLFGAVAHRSGGLAMPTGVHAAMNLAREATGERGDTPLWTIVADDGATASLATAAPLIGLVVTLLVAAAVWWWPARRTVPHSGAP